ncbi:RxLR effector protein [Phytophthora megakarya]|uniref:RxLR effector protein n=1 Tax=Phytophthora megakarya TaxID=4795 RepID=A0A225UY75_9STRA|nr:RxLR effector protein [Phytophthora megakarya]
MSVKINAIKASTTHLNNSSTTRFLRTRETFHVNDEERRWGEFVAKLKRLAKYNMWIFTNRDFDWIKTHHPELLTSYIRFWENRMVRGGEYA